MSWDKPAAWFLSGSKLFDDILYELFFMSIDFSAIIFIDADTDLIVGKETSFAGNLGKKSDEILYLFMNYFLILFLSLENKFVNILKKLFLTLLFTEILKLVKLQIFIYR